MQLRRMSRVASSSTSPKSAAVITAFTPESAAAADVLIRADSGMGMGATQDAAVQHAGRRCVGAIERTTRYLVDAIGARQPLADDLEFALDAAGFIIESHVKPPSCRRQRP